MKQDLRIRLLSPAAAWYFYVYCVLGKHPLPSSRDHALRLPHDQAHPFSADDGPAPPAALRDLAGAGPPLHGRSSRPRAERALRGCSTPAISSLLSRSTCRSHGDHPRPARAQLGARASALACSRVIARPAAHAAANACSPSRARDCQRSAAQPTAHLRDRWRVFRCHPKARMYGQGARQTAGQLHTTCTDRLAGAHAGSARPALAHGYLSRWQYPAAHGCWPGGADADSRHEEFGDLRACLNQAHTAQDSCQHQAAPAAMKRSEIAAGAAICQVLFVCSTVMTTFPRACPASRYRSASGTSRNG
jgi:hypothetical protein